MDENLPVSGGVDADQKRDLLLRRLIVIFVFAAVLTFWTAVGLSAWNEAVGRVDLAQQQMSVPATSR
jgi:hypothetical protein